MSMDRCECDRLVDTDDDPEFYVGPNDEKCCHVCRDERGSCEYCGDVLDKDGACYREECRAQVDKERASENRHNDPRRR